MGHVISVFSRATTGNSAYVNWLNFRSLAAPDPAHNGVKNTSGSSIAYSNGASSLEYLPSGVAGAVTFQAVNSSGNPSVGGLVVGLSANDTTVAISEQIVGMEFLATGVYCIEAGVQSAQQFASWLANDVFAISVNANGSVDYKKNGTTFRSLGAGTITTSVFVDVSFKDAVGQVRESALLGGWLTNYPTSITPLPVTSGLEFWVSASQIPAQSDNTSILYGGWPEISGNRRHAGRMGTTPKYRTASGPNSTPCIQLNGTSDFFSVYSFMSGISMTAAEMFVVSKVATDPPVSAKSSHPVASWDGLGSVGNHYPWITGDILDGFASNARKTVGNPAPSLTSWRTYNARSAAGAWSAHLDGTQLFTTATNTVSFASAQPKLGNTGSGVFMEGFIAEVIIFSRVLSSGERSQIHTYLNSLYGFSLP